MQMKLAPLVACMAVLSLTACAQPLAPSSQPAQADTASLSLSLAPQWRTQAVASDVASAAITVTVPEQTPRTFKVDLTGDVLIDLKELPRGDAMVHVDAFDQDNHKIGEGDEAVALRIGLRTYARVNVMLNPEGRTDYVPLIPLD